VPSRELIQVQSARLQIVGGKSKRVVSPLLIADDGHFLNVLTLLHSTPSLSNARPCAGYIMFGKHNV
jgi:hypothetical protein